MQARAPEPPIEMGPGGSPVHAVRTRLAGSSDDLRALITLAPDLANTTYRNPLIDYACAGPKLPRRLVAKAHRIRKN
ncbi:hypothetical protein QF027_000838 [Streptomyces canus]|nr:hypothetical protein [Streptomyces canus]